MIKSLLWKEWRECRWKMAVLFGVYLMLVLPAYALGRAELRDAQFVNEGLAFFFPGAVAMGIIADERVHRTAQTLQALPVPSAAVFFTKFIAGLATLLLPMLAFEVFCQFLFLTQAEEFRNTQPYWIFSMVGLTTSLYIWILMLAARLRSELAVGLAYVAFLLAFLVMGSLYAAVLVPRPQNHGYDVPTWAAFLFAFTPLGFARASPESPDFMRLSTLLMTTVAQLLTWIPLLFIAAWRYASLSPTRIARPADEAPTPAVVTFTPRRYPIFWKSWRESRRLVLGYLAVVTAFLFAIWAFIPTEVGDFFMVGPPILFGFSITLLLGVDVGMRESETHLENFWMSRPIPRSSYFRQRYFFGLLFSLVVLIMPLALTLLIMSLQLFMAGYGSSPPLDPDKWMWRNLYEVRGYAANCLLYLAPEAILFYTVAVFMASLSRRRIIPLVTSFGFCLFIQTFCPTMMLVESFEHNTSMLLFFYLLFTLGISAFFYWLGQLSTTHNWRARMESPSEISWKTARTATT